MMKTYTCIGCPLSCAVTVVEEGKTLSVSGYSCNKGRKYAIDEHRAPKRSLTGTVAIEHGGLRRLPVVSAVEVPKEKIKECMKILYSITVVAPIQTGDVVVNDICGTGVDIVASRDVE